MSLVQQLNIFDCDTNIQQNDWIFQRLEALQIERTLNVGELKISRTERFYVVEKEAEFEEVFRNIERCYEFINQNLLH
ncbi:hypothetical protein FJQ98_20585 [Lysinibacillus agricola]|uniref:Uncharacterized protein n=1 Tax=Lysinibacillus agricola TaxID=2590012 RepID=A0ABX7ARP0_9BACI|nr:MULTISPECIES: hypothetical protein [Lysinibacillus]KOS60881.1 hypothetical protein AN161_20075 [Lysinibacillus sp. FJAT-14222]QQP11568.1 hypothetical protein FJQ98_20585 [Lysinibacillus agricola]